MYLPRQTKLNRSPFLLLLLESNDGVEEAVLIIASDAPVTI